MAQERTTGGLRLWSLVWGGQLVSLVGSGLTSFALGVWAYQRSGSVTQFALIVFFAGLPGIVLAPVAGTLVDRWDRRRVMIGADTGNALLTAAVAVLLWTGSLEVWHIYVAAGLSSLCKTFQWPAYIAASTVLVPKRHFARVGGMMQFGHAASEIVAPVVAGTLMAAIGIEGVLLVDCATFVFAVGALAIVRIPRPERTAEGEAAGKLPFTRQMTYGFRYIARRRGLLGLLVLFALVNFMVGMVMVLLTPMVLSFTSPAVLGTVLSVSSAGMLLGSVAMIVTGGPRRRVHGVLAFGLVLGVAVFVAALRPWAPLVAGGVFLMMFGVPVINGCSQAIWQSKVAPDVQGRVFAVRRLVAQCTLPIASLSAGPLADRVFEPAMMPGGALAGSLGTILGVGEGRGIALLFGAVAVLPVLASIAAWSYRPVRDVETDLPDAVPDDGDLVVTTGGGPDTDAAGASRAAAEA